jgi:hypothetical protein
MIIHPTNPRTIVLSRDDWRQIARQAHGRDPAVIAAREKRRALATAMRIDRFAARLLAGLKDGES